jgi:hypothetical protein
VPQSLHLLCTRPCWQKPPVPQSMHLLLVRPCSHLALLAALHLLLQQP